MSISQSFLGEFEHEAATTRKCLERVPEDKLTWKPHEKSFSLGDLAGHIVTMSTVWAEVTVNQDVFDMHPPGGEMYQEPKVTNIPALLAKYDEGIAKVKAAMAATDDAKWMTNWSLAMQGNTIMTMPRVAVMRSFVFNHIIHHRGQLSVYLRELNVAVPSIYGPSADEGNM